MEKHRILRYPRKLLFLALLPWQKICYKLADIGLPITKNERRLLEYRDRHKGERAFVIGNGPSLNRCDLKLLKKEVTFGVNSIFLNYENMGFHPTYYLVEDFLLHLNLQ